MLCPRGEAKLTAALPPEQNDIVCTLSPLPPSPPPPVYAPPPPLHECWQHKLHSSAVFPLCRSRSCMSSAYLCGMGLFKGERSLQGQCACVRAGLRPCAHFTSLLSPSPPCPPPCLHPHPSTPEEEQRALGAQARLSILFYSLALNNKRSCGA